MFREPWFVVWSKISLESWFSGVEGSSELVSMFIVSVDSMSESGTLDADDKLDVVRGQYQKTQVQSSEARAYLALFRLSFASLRRLRINWYNVSRPSWRPSPVIAQAGWTLMQELPGDPAISRTPRCFSNSPTSLAPARYKNPIKTTTK